MKNNLFIGASFLFIILVIIFTKTTIAQNNCARINSVQTDISQMVINSPFHCIVTVENEYRESPYIACGISINNSYPQNYCPSDINFGGWKDNKAYFNCLIPPNTNIKANDVVELVAFDFRPECGPTTGIKLKLIQLLNPQTNNNSQSETITNSNPTNVQKQDDLGRTPIVNPPLPWSEIKKSQNKSPLDVAKPLEAIVNVLFFTNLSNNKNSSLPQTKNTSSDNSNNITLTQPNLSFKTLRELFFYVSQKTSVPYCVLEAIATMEYGSVFRLPPEVIIASSVPGKTMPNCPHNSCSATGVMQMTTGIDNLGSPSCSNCCWRGSCLSRCPNAWTTYGNAVNEYEQTNHLPNPCNIKDSIFAAAKKLAKDSEKIGSEWTDARIFEAGRRYFGDCRTPVRDGKTYCQFIIDYCKL